MGKKNKIPKASPKPPETIAVPVVPGKIKKQMGLFIALFSFALYVQSVSFDYAYDDLTVIQSNKIIQSGLKGIPDLLNSDYWYGFNGKKEGAIFRPASLIMFAVEWQLFPGNPMPGHLINVLLFSVTCVLMFLLLCRLFQNNLVFPFICTVLYAAHPIHTEVVNNIKSRDEILSFLFSILALQFYLRYYSAKKIYSLLAGALFFFLAMLSKETAISFLMIIPLTLFVFRETNRRKLIYTGLTLIVAAVIYLALRQMISNGRPIIDGIGRSDNFMILAENYGEVLASAIFILLKYLQLLVFPHPLSSDYSYAQIGLKSFGDPWVIFSLLLFAAATVFSLIMIRKKNIYAYGILFFLISIFPVSNIPFLFGSSMAERFLYTPSFGFCILLALLISKIAKTPVNKMASISLGGLFKNYRILLMITAMITFLFSVKTFLRSRDWENNLTLFSKAAKASPNSARARYGYGSALFNSAIANEGSPTEVAGKFELAKSEFETSLSIFPGFWSSYMGLGLYYKNKNDFKNSVLYFENARDLSPDKTANIYKELGYAYLKNGEFARSLSTLDSAILLGLNAANVFNFKGSALFGLQRYNEALSAYLKASELDPADVEILKNIGRSYYYLVEYDKAAAYFKRSLEMQPGNSENYQFLGLVYQVMGDTARANPLLRQYEMMRNSGQ